MEELLIKGAETKNGLLKELAIRTALRNDENLYLSIEKELAEHEKTSGLDYFEVSRTYVIGFYFIQAFNFLFSHRYPRKMLQKMSYCQLHGLMHLKKYLPLLSDVWFA